MMKHLVNVNNQQRAMSGINYRNGDEKDKQTGRQLRPRPLWRLTDYWAVVPEAVADDVVVVAAAAASPLR